MWPTGNKCYLPAFLHTRDGGYDMIGEIKKGYLFCCRFGPGNEKRAMSVILILLHFTVLDGHDSISQRLLYESIWSPTTVFNLSQWQGLKPA